MVILKDQLMLKERETLKKLKMLKAILACNRKSNNNQDKFRDQERINLSWTKCMPILSKMTMGWLGNKKENSLCNNKIKWLENNMLNKTHNIKSYRNSSKLNLKWSILQQSYLTDNLILSLEWHLKKSTKKVKSNKFNNNNIICNHLNNLNSSTNSSLNSHNNNKFFKDKFKTKALNFKLVNLNNKKWPTKRWESTWSKRKKKNKPVYTIPESNRCNITKITETETSLIFNSNKNNNNLNNVKIFRNVKIHYGENDFLIFNWFFNNLLNWFNLV